MLEGPGYIHLKVLQHKFDPGYPWHRLITFSLLCSFSSSTFFANISIGSFSRPLPIISSRNSSIPVSCSFGDFGFINDICSTSPYNKTFYVKKKSKISSSTNATTWRIRNLLWSKSIPCDRNNFETSLNGTLSPFMQ